MRIGKNLMVYCFLVLLVTTLNSQTLQTSNLPIIIIDTNGQEIVSEPKITVQMGIISNSSGVNSVNDPFNNYNGKITIELRGASSQSFAKKGYGFELKEENGSDRSEELLGMPEEEDWILHGPYSDKSLIRNVLTFHLWEATGRYGSRTRLCELMIDDDYKGVYVLMEKIKRDQNRLDISSLNPDENTGDDVTGGYILKIDKTDGSNSGVGFISQHAPIPAPFGQEIYFQYEYPKGDEITAQQANYITGAIRKFENSLAGEDYLDSENGYRNFISVKSFVDFALLNEISRNVDGYRLSTYLFKEKDSNGGQIHLGPPWDFNLSFGNADYCDGSSTEGWAMDFNQVCDYDYWLIPFWWDRLMSDPLFRSAMRTRWESLRSNEWSNSAINSFIDEKVEELSAAQARNRQRWPEVNDYIWPNPVWNDTYAEDIAYLRSWIENRLEWLDSNIGEFEIITGFNSIDPELVTVFPNPVNEFVTVKSNQGIDFIELIDLNGKLLLHEKVDADSKTIDLSKLPVGEYVLQCYIQGRPIPRLILKE